MIHNISLQLRDGERERERDREGEREMKREREKGGLINNPALTIVKHF